MPLQKLHKQICGKSSFEDPNTPPIELGEIAVDEEEVLRETKVDM